MRYGFGENGLVKREEVEKDGRLWRGYKLKESVLSPGGQTTIERA